jgi:hypothetical protein
MQGLTVPVLELNQRTRSHNLQYCEPLYLHTYCTYHYRRHVLKDPNKNLKVSFVCTHKINTFTSQEQRRLILELVPTPEIFVHTLGTDIAFTYEHEIMG